MTTGTPGGGTPASAMGTWDTFPKLLARNAPDRARAAAYREKDYGIWQSWTWAETQARSGAGRGARRARARAGRPAIIGRNRPQLYWSMVAAQCCGARAGAALPGRGGRGDGLRARALRRALRDRRRPGAGRQGARGPGPAAGARADRLSRSARPAELRPRPAARATPSVQAQGRARRAAARAASGRASPGQGADDTCVMLYTSGTTGRPKGVVLSNRNIIATAQASAEFDRLTAEDSVLAYLPMAWVGDFIFSMGQAYWAGLLRRLPGERRRPCSTTCARSGRPTSSRRRGSSRGC